MRVVLQALIPVAIYFGGFWIFDGRFLGHLAREQIWVLAILLATSVNWPRRLPVKMSDDGLTLIIREGRPWLRLPVSTLAGYRVREGHAANVELFTRNGNTYPFSVTSKRKRSAMEAILRDRCSLPALAGPPEPVRLIPWPDGPPQMAAPAGEA
jgi:hypothetical protein